MYNTEAIKMTYLAHDIFFQPNNFLAEKAQLCDSKTKIIGEFFGKGGMIFGIFWSKRSDLHLLISRIKRDHIINNGCGQMHQLHR